MFYADQKPMIRLEDRKSGHVSLEKADRVAKCLNSALYGASMFNTPGNHIYK